MISHFNAQSAQNPDFTVLNAFFQQLRQLETLRYLPSIAQMVLTLNTISRQIDRTYAQSTKLATLLNTASNSIFDESSAQAIRKGAENLRKIWPLIKPAISLQFAKSAAHSLLDDTTISYEQLPLSYLLASASNEGSHVYRALFYLINLQNEFLRLSRGTAVDEELVVELEALTASECISFRVDKELMQIVHMNTSYSYEARDQVNLEYDFAKIQASVMKRFLEDKSVISTSRIPLIEFSDDINDMTRLQALDKAVNQTELEYAVKEKIASFYKQPNELNDIVRMVHIVIDFVISSGCTSNMKIIDYAVNVLRMRNIHESKVSKHVSSSLFLSSSDQPFVSRFPSH